MKKRKVVAGLTALGLMLGITACKNFKPGEEEPVAIYGPPNWMEQESQNQQDVYGPPSWEDEVTVSEEESGSEVTEDETEKEEVIDEFNPAEEEQSVIYGPPPFSEEE